MPLRIERSDVYRATLADDCGNIGFVGLAPDGSGYHIVVPVDLQIARGVKAGNRPDDGTPFGGYKGWLYFECLPFSPDEPDGRDRRTRFNADALIAWAAGRGLAIEVDK